MEFSEEVLSGLASLKDAKRLPDQPFQQLVELAFDIAAGIKTEADLRGTNYEQKRKKLPQKKTQQLHCPDTPVQ